MTKLLILIMLCFVSCKEDAPVQTHTVIHDTVYIHKVYTHPYYEKGKLKGFMANLPDTFYIPIGWITDTFEFKNNNP